MKKLMLTLILLLSHGAFSEESINLDMTCEAQTSDFSFQVKFKDNYGTIEAFLNERPIEIQSGYATKSEEYYFDGYFILITNPSSGTESASLFINTTDNIANGLIKFSKDISGGVNCTHN